MGRRVLFDLSALAQGWIAKNSAWGLKAQVHYF